MKKSIKNDLLIGVAVAGLVALVAALQVVPVTGKGIAVFVLFGLSGALLHQILAVALSGLRMDSAGLIRSFFVTALLAISAQTDVVWACPQQWSDLLKLSFFGASLFIVLYFIVDFYNLSTRGKSVNGAVSLLILSVPYVFGLLLLLQSANLLSVFHYNIIGQVLIVFLVNEFAANAISLLVGKQLVRGMSSHIWLLFPAIAVIIAPKIADFGAGTTVAGWLPVIRNIVSVLCTAVSQAALWAEAFLLTGLILDGMRGQIPDRNIIAGNSKSGMIKGAVFSAILMGLIQVAGLLSVNTVVIGLYRSFPFIFFAVLFALVFPLIKTIIESFDGSQRFWSRAFAAWRNPVLYGRGFVVGLVFAFAVSFNLPAKSTEIRILYGAVAGIIAFAGVSFIRDMVLGIMRHGGIKSWRLYLVESGLGLFIGAALAFYFDVNQLPIILAKFHLYNSFGMNPDALVAACNEVRTTRPDEFRALLNNWGYIKLSAATGGAKILFNEALIGVSVWGIAAWLFAVNKAFLQALFDKSWAPIKQIPTRAGVNELVAGTIRVMRWGLWMSPIIFTFLRPMGTPTWYNQDGAIRTLFATVNSIFMSPDAFNEWSLHIFLWILVYSGFRILIFIDHMGLRVATLVNLSFIGMDRLDERVARFIGPDAAARFIPEAVKRFTTWAPLLIPFYLPAGEEWARVWNESRAMLASSHGGVISAFMSLAIFYQFAIIVLIIFITAAISYFVRGRKDIKERNNAGRQRIANLNYEVILKRTGELNSNLYYQDIMLTRPSYEGVEPAGRALFVTECFTDGTTNSWPILGNFPEELFPAATYSGTADSLQILHTYNDIEVAIKITIPDTNDAVEHWQVKITNKSDKERNIKITPYFEWLLNSPVSDRNHTQYNRLYPEMSYDSERHAIIATHNYTHKTGFLAADKMPEGYLNNRVDFIGRAGTVWSPRALQTLSFRKSVITEPYPVFDPMGALLVGVAIKPGDTVALSFVAGCADSVKDAGMLIDRYLVMAKTVVAKEQQVCCQQDERRLLIGHGEILSDTVLPYTEYEDGGATLHIRTPFTPRPFDHTMSNAGGHILSVTNRGLHCSANGNAQQNRLTTDWADLVGRELPAEAFYIYDADIDEWYSPAYEPLRDDSASYDVRFSLYGTARFNMQKDGLETELLTYVPVDESCGVYMLTIKNRQDKSRRLRVASYFQIALAHSPEMAGKIKVKTGTDGRSVFFENPNNSFRKGPAFVAMSCKPDMIVTERGKFFGRGRSFAHPAMVDRITMYDITEDNAACAAFMKVVEIPAHSEETVVVLLGQSDTRTDAEKCIKNLGNIEAAVKYRDAAIAWWKNYISTLKVETSDAEFNSYVDWMKYQALAERIWARKGFYQASGAFGFRDQLQDTVNLIWVDASYARKQLVLHAGQQFIEGDVAHWFFYLQDGRTGFLSRSHASDNLLWLGWGIAEYVRMTGDSTILDEQVSYLHSESPLPPLPECKHGMGFLPMRSPLSENVYRHVMRAIDLVLEKRMGRNGLPLIGTGDWNDGLDEIGSEGKGESVWLAFFLCYILNNFMDIIEDREGADKRSYYEHRLAELKLAIENCWRGDRYLRAIHDDGTEIGVKGAGYWETDALTAAWAVYANTNSGRARIAVDTALDVLESDNVISLGYPPLREDIKPYLGRSSRYPEGVRENGMYSHGVQWLVRACRLLSEQFVEAGDEKTAGYYRDAAARIWYKISAISHTTPEQIEIYGGQPNKQCADYLTKYEPGRMIWNGYTGAAAWMLRQAIEGVLGYQLDHGHIIIPKDIDKPRGKLKKIKISSHKFTA